MAQSTEIKALREDIADLQKVVNRIGDRHEGNGIDTAALQARARLAGENVRHWFEDKKIQALEGQEKAESVIRSRPFASVAIAAAAGMMISALLTRRR